ncbi:hypothetical protein COO60DRAFT_1625174 [Scenedesmus sp. NREL 46B-D3]|nr:hypothetical protein COO60DRAFT_1625174 [Scenedesmus sp. NREL 46B-D3]
MSRVALVAFGALLALQCALAQSPPGPAATGVPTEMSSSIILSTIVVSSGAAQLADLPHTARESCTLCLSAVSMPVPAYVSSLSQCELLVRRAAKHGGRRLQFVPTHYWYEAKNLQYAPNTCHADNWSLQNKVEYYCQKHEWNSDCRPFDQGALDTFRRGLTDCFKVAASLFDEVLIAPHLDEGLKRGKWRNMLHFDPLWKDPNGYSYWDIMLKPILDAANEAFPAGKTFLFGVEGEMGGTVLSNPAQYLKVYNMIRTGWKSAAKLLVGSTFNHAYIMGHITRGPGSPPPLPPTPMAALDGGWGPVLPFEQWPNYQEAKRNLPAIRQLLAASDFLGVSNYARAGDGMNVLPRHIESGVAKVQAEFMAMGINFRDIIIKGNKILIYNEFGLGGGVSECGDTPGKGPEIGFFPWLGITTPYAPENDPFKRYPDAKKFLLNYYRTALDVLNKGGDQFPVHQSYMWNVVSWDGDWPVRNGFAVQEVIDMVKSHNSRTARRATRRP